MLGKRIKSNGVVGVCTKVDAEHAFIGRQRFPVNSVTIVGDGPHNHRATIALKALLYGIPVTLGEHTYQLFQEGDEVPLGDDTGETTTYAFGAIVNHYFLGTNLSLTDFLAAANRLTDDEVTLLAAAIALKRNAEF